jgi:hypothetical protein
MTTIPRRTGVALIIYGLGVTAAFLTLGSPGGDYDPDIIASYISRGHWPAAFALAYLSAFCALALLAAGHGLRTAMGGALGDFVWGLSIAGTATGVVGAFVTGGLDVSMAEGGHQVQNGVAQPIVYTISEIGNLIAVCGPAFFAGVIAMVWAARGPMPLWLRVFSVVAGACGILAPFFFTYFLFVLWTIVTGLTLIAQRAAPQTTTAEPAPSLV